MENSILELLKSIEAERSFFEKQKKYFAENFLKEMLEQKSRNGANLLSAPAILTIGEKLYILLFLSKKDPLKELYKSHSQKSLFLWILRKTERKFVELSMIFQ